LRGAPARIEELSTLIARHARGCSTIVALLHSGLDSPEPALSVEAGLDRTRRLFDHSVTCCEEASVAFYSLGSAELLAAATDEVVSVLDEWGVLANGRDALEIGCGIGRFLIALSGRLRSLIGLDISSNMIEVASRRASEQSNARALVTSGRDLSQFSDDSFDLVLGIDTFPYLVRAGGALVETHFQEVSRVLRPAGDFIIFNFAYGRSREQDAREVRELSLGCQLSVERLDETPFRIWNAVGYHLTRH
jgi:cyclopropane fatty-acyl-phospholipid synthase-like methyltransferase